MEWGEVPAWAALVISLGAFGASVKALKDGRRSADAAEASVTEARRSADAAELSVTEARRSGSAAERSATAAEEALGHQRQQDTERRAAEVEAGRPKVLLAVEHFKKSTWQLINDGTKAAVNVRLVDAVPALHQPWPDSLTLEPGEPFNFNMSGDHDHRLPSAIKVVWDGAQEPEILRVPPGIG